MLSPVLERRVRSNLSHLPTHILDKLITFLIDEKFNDRSFYLLKFDDIIKYTSIHHTYTLSIINYIRDNEESKRKLGEIRSLFKKYYSYGNRLTNSNIEFSPENCEDMLILAKFYGCEYPTNIAKFSYGYLHIGGARDYFTILKIARKYRINIKMPLAVMLDILCIILTPQEINYEFIVRAFARNISDENLAAILDLCDNENIRHAIRGIYYEARLL